MNGPQQNCNNIKVASAGINVNHESTLFTVDMTQACLTGLQTRSVGQVIIRGTYHCLAVSLIRVNTKSCKRNECSCTVAIYKNNRLGRGRRVGKSGGEGERTSDTEGLHGERMDNFESVNSDHWTQLMTK